MYILSFQCKYCGWDWLGTFAHCPNCKGNNVKVLDFETIEEFNERIIMMEERQNSVYFIIKDKEIE
jgi:hypothetical protein